MKVTTIAYSRTFFPQPYHAVKIDLMAEVNIEDGNAETVLQVRQLASLAHTAYEILIKAGDPCDEKLKEEVLMLLERKKNFNEHLLEQPCK